MEFGHLEGVPQPQVLGDLPSAWLLILGWFSQVHYQVQPKNPLLVDPNHCPAVILWVPPDSLSIFRSDLVAEARSQLIHTDGLMSAAKAANG